MAVGGSFNVTYFRTVGKSIRHFMSLYGNVSFSFNKY